jgi:hypothetical protein
MKRSHSPETPSNADEDTDKEPPPHPPTRGLSPSPSPSPTPQNILDRIRTHTAIAPHYNDAEIAQQCLEVFLLFNFTADVPPDEVTRITNEKISEFEEEFSYDASSVDSPRTPRTPSQARFNKTLLFLSRIGRAVELDPIPFNPHLQSLRPNSPEHETPQPQNIGRTQEMDQEDEEDEEAWDSDDAASTSMYSEPKKPQKGMNLFVSTLKLCSSQNG